MKAYSFFIATSWDKRPVSSHFRALSDELALRGHRVLLLISGPRRDVEDHKTNPSVWSWPSIRPVKLSDALFLAGLIRRHRPSCLVANFGASNLMLLIGWLMGSPRRVDWYHTLSTQIDIDAAKPRWKIKLLRYRKRMVYKAATHLVPVSAAARDDLSTVFNVPAGKCVVWHNSLADPLPSLSSQQRPVTPRNTLLCVGRLHPSKGQDTLIRAAAILKQSITDFSLEFIGTGRLKMSYCNLARDLGVEEWCLLLGALDHDEVLKRMASSVATVLPSRSDNCPLVVIESFAVGTPVIASRVGGIPELIRDGVDGYLVPPENPMAFAEKLRLLLTDPELRRKMSTNARESFLMHFEQKRVVRQQAEWFESLVSGLD
jgi:glycosyltransferase involved in cell wall biosynthesis